MFRTGFRTGYRSKWKLNVRRDLTKWLSNSLLLQLIMFCWQQSTSNNRHLSFVSFRLCLLNVVERRRRRRPIFFLRLTHCLLWVCRWLSLPPTPSYTSLHMDCTCECVCVSSTLDVLPNQSSSPSSLHCKATHHDRTNLHASEYLYGIGNLFIRHLSHITSISFVAIPVVHSLQPITRFPQFPPSLF